LGEADFNNESFFNLSVPEEIEGLPSGILNPRGTWSDGGEYDLQAARLVEMFRENFKQFAENVDPSIREQNPGG